MGWIQRLKYTPKKGIIMIRNNDGELALRAAIDGTLDDILENPSEDNFETLKNMINTYETAVRKLYKEKLV